MTTTWKEFIRTHMEVLVATDFFTAEVWTLDVHFISSLPVMQGTAYKAWVDSKPVQMVWGVD